jgi:peptide-methionine (S)-S-oxide reductase
MMLRFLSVLVALLGALLAGTRLPAQPSMPPPASHQGDALEVATFAGGCFWCIEADFDKVAGVVETTSGFMGGRTKNPTYSQVAGGRTGHAEVVQVRFDPKVVSYAQLLDVYWHKIDPLDAGGQFSDRGSAYRPAIFYHNEEQRRLAEASKAALVGAKVFSRPIVVEITKATEFTRAEEYHQDYYRKSPMRYLIYRHGSGRDARLEALWGRGQSVR